MLLLLILLVELGFLSLRHSLGMFMDVLKYGPNVIYIYICIYIIGLVEKTWKLLSRVSGHHPPQNGESNGTKVDN